MIIGAAAITFAGLFVVYGGPEYLGATGSGLVADEPVIKRFAMRVETRPSRVTCTGSTAVPTPPAHP